MGSIPFFQGVEIGEPSQRGLIAFNGHEKLLILSTDLRASKRSKVLEVIPLPAEPSVKRADSEIFANALKIINEKLRASRPPTGGDTFGSGSSGPPAEPAGRGQIVGITQIGVDPDNPATVHTWVTGAWLPL